MTTKDLGMVTAYAYAVMGGYEGTEAEFEALLGNIATDLEEIENLTVVANTLPEGSSATASYADGVLTLGIPKGDTGATGAGATATVGTTTTGDPGTNASVTNSGTTKDAVFNFTIPRGATGNGIESIYLTGTSGAVKTYTILFTDGNTTTFDVTDGEVTNASLAEVLEDYAKTDGAYESMTVGNAEQLISSVTVNDKVPYNFRTSGGSIDIGNREVDKLVGGTVAWNQLIQNGDFSDGTTNWSNVYRDTWSTSDKTLNITLATNNGATRAEQAVNAIVGHKYLFMCEVWSSENSPCTATFSGTGTTAMIAYSYLNANVWTKVYGIRSATDSDVSTNVIRIYYAKGTPTIGTTRKVKNIQLFDLTQMFGSAIADYIYSLETATAGAGVAWFKKLFPKDYYPYNAGQLISVKTSAHNTVGFNQWDEVTELGYYNVTTGEPATSSQNLRSKNFIPVVPNTSYYAKIPTGYIAICEYDANKNFIKCTQGIANSGITTTDDTHFIRFHCTSAYGTTYNHDICINLHWDGERDGEYESYVKHEYALDNSLTLRGIPKLDASNNLYYDGDTYESDGTVMRKWGFYTIQTSDITLDDGGGYTNVVCAKIQNLPDMLKTNTKQAIHSKYGVAQVVWTFDNTSNIGKLANNPATQAYWFIFPVGTTIEQMRTALSGTTIVYELATPTTEEADPYQNPQIVDDFGTEEYVDERTVAIPVGHDTEYMNNLKAKLEMAPDSPDGDGDYIVRQTNGENSYVPLMKELPSLPTTDGTYTLKCTVASGTATLGWEREE